MQGRWKDKKNIKVAQDNMMLSLIHLWSSGSENSNICDATHSIRPHAINFSAGSCQLSCAKCHSINVQSISSHNFEWKIEQRERGK